MYSSRYGQASNPTTCEHMAAYQSSIRTMLDADTITFANDGRPIPCVNGNARIIRASLNSSQRQIGIKCIIKKSDVEECKRQEQALKRELAVWATLSGPNILSLSGVVTLDLKPNEYVSPSAVFDFYERGDITMYIRSKHQPNDLNRVRLLQEAAAGLSYVHSEGIVHGDVKGANILIDTYETARVCDFGSAYAPKCPNCIAGAPAQFHSLKTQRYLSPELLLESDPPPTQESDVWALGCVLLEVQTGIVPYETENDPYGVIALRKQVLKRELPAHERAFSRNAITEAVGLVAFECWILNPDDRPTARDVVDMLDEVCDAFEPTPVPSPVDEL